MNRMRNLLTIPLRLALVALMLVMPGLSTSAEAQLRLRFTDGVIEPMPFALPAFVAEGGGSGQAAADISALVAQDLVNSGLFREIPASAHISRVQSFDAPVQFEDWRAINAQALITGAVSVQGSRLIVKFRLFDVFNGQQMGEGLQFAGTVQSWRRMAHKVADAVYSRITGESGYFDSRIVFVSETGPKNARAKRLAVADYDGANLQFLTDSSALVLAPRFSPTGDRILYTSYESGFPQIVLMDVATGARRGLGQLPGEMTFAPRFSPDGRSVVFSATQGGNTDLFVMPVAGGSASRLTSAPSIETAPSYSPDGSQIVFESDRTGGQQIYVMSASGGEPRRISQGRGRYGTPVWSPRGDLIAFTKQLDGRFHIGVMRTDGSEERLLTASFLDEGPTWAPNGRVIMFTRESAGPAGQPGIFSVDITGRNPPRMVPVQGGASDPAWSPLLP
jgi:TolB protein